jgi:hypothetical protein
MPSVLSLICGLYEFHGFSTHRRNSLTAELSQHFCSYLFDIAIAREMRSLPELVYVMWGNYTLSDDAFPRRYSAEIDVRGGPR